MQKDKKTEFLTCIPIVVQMKMQKEKNYDFGDEGGGGKFSSGTQTQYRKGDKKPKKGKK
jgi:hypothetical protein